MTNSFSTALLNRKWTPVVALVIAGLLALIIPGRTPSIAASASLGPARTPSAEAVASGGDSPTFDLPSLGAFIPGVSPLPVVPRTAEPEENLKDVPPPPKPPLTLGPAAPALLVVAPFAAPACGVLGVVGLVLSGLRATLPIDPQIYANLVFTACGVIPLPATSTTCPNDQPLVDAVGKSPLGAALPQPKVVGESVDALLALESLLTGKSPVVGQVGNALNCVTTQPVN